MIIFTKLIDDNNGTFGAFERDGVWIVQHSHNGEVQTLYSGDSREQAMAVCEQAAKSGHAATPVVSEPVYYGDDNDGV